jgi:hypothetical protein
VLSAGEVGAAEEQRMTPREQEEYTALRATIRARGTARVWVFGVGLAVWSSLALAAVALALPPVATLLPLALLLAVFEAVLALHVGVERVGRYLLAFYDDGWERVAGEFGRPRGAIGVDALFANVFVIAAFLNLIPLLATPPAGPELAVVGVAHLAFIARVIAARAAAARQRTVDTQRFEEIRKR